MYLCLLKITPGAARCYKSGSIKAVGQKLLEAVTAQVTVKDGVVTFLHH